MGNFTYKRDFKRVSFKPYPHENSFEMLIFVTLASQQLTSV